MGRASEERSQEHSPKAIAANISAAQHAATDLFLFD
jgi:hypothetical protein